MMRVPWNSFVSLRMGIEKKQNLSVFYFPNFSVNGESIDIIVLVNKLDVQRVHNMGLGSTFLKFIYKVIALIFLKNPYMSEWAFEKYQRPVNFLRMFINQCCFLLRINYAPFPLSAAVNVTSKCNLKCKICRGQYPDLEKNPVDMPLSTFKTILTHLPNSIETVLLSNLGEPLLHPNIFAIIRCTARAGFRPILFTNGTLLTKQMCSKLLSAPLYSISVSIETDPINCQEIRGFNLSDLEFKVYQLLQIRKEMKSNVRIALSLVIHKANVKMVTQFLAKWKGVVDDIKISPVQLNERNPQLRRCVEFWRGNLSVRPDGLVTPCCVDFHGELIIGNAIESNLLEIWNGVLMRIIRAAVVKNKFPAKCCNCRWGEFTGNGRTWKRVYSGT